MMEQGELMKVRTLKERFQNEESSKGQTKPALPEKPKSIPPISPTSKISNPLIASINSAMGNRFAPRVIFKDDKKTQPSSQPETSLVKAKPILLDKNQKKEADLIKQALKDKKNLPSSPPAPNLEQTPKPEPVQKSSGLETPSKISSPVKKSILINTDKKENEKTYPQEWDVPVTPSLNHLDSIYSTPVKTEATVYKPPSPKALIPPARTNLPSSPPAPNLEQTPKPEPVQKSSGLETPSKISSPVKKSILINTDKKENEKTYPQEWDVPVTPSLNHLDSIYSTPVKTEATVYKPPSPKALIPPVRTNPPISPQVTSPPSASVSKPPVLAVPEPIPKNGPQMEIPKPEPRIRLNTNATPSAGIVSHGSPQKATPSPEITDILHMDIPPPIIPEDFSDGGSSVQDISANVIPKPSFSWSSPAVTPISSSPAISHRVSPIPATETPNSDSAFIFSPLPTYSSPSTNVESMAENRLPEPRPVFDYPEKPLDVSSSSSPRPSSVVSALARAEEMAPIKHNACDQRLLKLLEKSKRKSAVSSQPSTFDMLPLIDTDLPSSSLFEPSQPETAHDEPSTHVNAPSVPEPLMTLPDFPPEDYEGKAAAVEPAPVPAPMAPMAAETAPIDQDHRKSLPSPKIVMVQKPLVPPPPPPRKPQSTVPNGGLTPASPSPQLPRPDLQSTIPPSQPPLQSPTAYNNPLPNGIIIPAPADFTSDDSTHEDSDILDPSETVGSQAPSPQRQQNTFFGHINMDHQTPNMDTIDDGLPRTVSPAATEHSASIPSSPFNLSIPSPSGKSFNSSTEMEDLATDKKSKIQKKTRKGSPLNPYADTSVVTEEIPKKALFSKKNSVSDDKQKQKEKEKEKEKEKKELKEKEKKEQKEKEKEKEQKEKEKKELKEKEKKEQKKKEQKEKELKEKDKDKKELKEKEKGKKEQKEKEKKENELKKKFKITGEEEAMYQAKVAQSTKGRKDDLAIKAGEIVSIIRTTDCPKGKWLARDSTNKYGYIPLESVELDVQEMMVIGNKAKANNKPSVNGIMDPETPSRDIISSHRYSLNQESFEDDSEDWGDEDDTVFAPTQMTNLELNHKLASSDIAPAPVPVLPTHTDRSDNIDAGKDVVHKLSTFFAQPKVPTLQNHQNHTPMTEPKPLAVKAEEPVSLLKQEAELQFLPPPDLYADIVVG